MKTIIMNRLSHTLGLAKEKSKAFMRSGGLSKNIKAFSKF